MARLGNPAWVETRMQLFLLVRQNQAFWLHYCAITFMH